MTVPNGSCVAPTPSPGTWSRTQASVPPLWPWPGWTRCPIGGARGAAGAGHAVGPPLPAASGRAAVPARQSSVDPDGLRPFAAPPSGRRAQPAHTGHRRRIRQDGGDDRVRPVPTSLAVHLGRAPRRGPCRPGHESPPLADRRDRGHAAGVPALRPHRPTRSGRPGAGVEHGRAGRRGRSSLAREALAHDLPPGGRGRSPRVDRRMVPSAVHLVRAPGGLGGQRRTRMADGRSSRFVAACLRHPLPTDDRAEPRPAPRHGRRGSRRSQTGGRGRSGGTVNDAFVASLTGGLRRYHELPRCKRSTSSGSPFRSPPARRGTRRAAIGSPSSRFPCPGRASPIRAGASG